MSKKVIDINIKSVTKGSVLDRQNVMDISQAADMQALKQVYRDMTDCEQGRTRDYLNKKIKKEN